MMLPGVPSSEHEKRSFQTTRTYISNPHRHQSAFMKHRIIERPFSSTNHINCLPVEVLIIILTFSLPSTGSPAYRDKSYPSFRLSWVCHHWRHVILGNTSFWKVINFAWNGEDRSECTAEILRRSGYKDLIVSSPSVTENFQRTKSFFAFNDFIRRDCRNFRIPACEAISEDTKGINLKIVQGLTLSSRLSKDVVQGILSTAKNLQEFHTWFCLDIPLSESILQLPSGLKKLTLSVDRESVLSILSRFQSLEYLDLTIEDHSDACTSYRLPAYVTLPRLRVLKMNGYIIDQLNAPALQYLATHPPPYTHIINDYHLFNTFNLSMFTHLHCVLGCIMSTRGCIWATVGPTNVPCLSSRPKLHETHDTLESLIHIHPQCSNLAEPFNAHRLLCKLISKMTSLDTLVVDASRPLHVPGSELIELDPLTSVLENVSQSTSSLQHLVIRSKRLRDKEIERLSISLESMRDSCPNLKSITLSSANLGPGTVTGKKLGALWANFLTYRKNSDFLPLKYVHLEGCPRVSRRSVQEVEESGTILTQLLRIDGPGCAFQPKVGF